jgi:hypothetical protein
MLSGRREGSAGAIKRLRTGAEAFTSGPPPPHACGASSPLAGRTLAALFITRSRRRCQTSYTLGSKKSGATKKCA